jgi:hypothetical protein
LSRSKIVRIVCASAEEAENVRTLVDHVEVRAFLGLAGSIARTGPPDTKRRLEYIHDVENPQNARLSVETEGTMHHVEASKALPASPR